MSCKISVLTPTIRPQFLDVTQQTLEEQTFTDFEWIVEVGFPNKGFTLPKDLNTMIRRSNGELIVFLQDCIKIEPDGLEKMWKSYQSLPRAMITAPVGKVRRWGENPQWDWRAHTPFQDKQQFSYWEIDWGAVAKKGLFEVGGFDEEFCKGWSWENVEIAARLEVLDYEVHCDPDNKAVAFDHDTIIEHPFRNKREPNDARARETRTQAMRGEFKLNYL